MYLQKAIKTITGEPLEGFVKKAVLDPLGMTHSHFVWNPDDQAKALSGHDAIGSASPISRYQQAVASSTFCTTLGDYACFVSALLARKSPLRSTINASIASVVPSARGQSAHSGHAPSR